MIPPHPPLGLCEATENMYCYYGVQCSEGNIALWCYGPSISVTNKSDNCVAVQKVCVVVHWSLFFPPPPPSMHVMFKLQQRFMLDRFFFFNSPHAIGTCSRPSRNVRAYSADVCLKSPYVVPREQRILKRRLWLKYRNVLRTLNWELQILHFKKKKKEKKPHAIMLNG